jgi:Tol biopolymer transport system component
MVTRRGGPGPDTIQGTANSDQLFGAGGDDTLFGLGGPDRLVGGPGRDTLNGGGGRDRLFGEAGNDMLRGGGGADTFFVRSARHGLDRVRDFDLVGNDKLEFRQALIPEYNPGDDIRDFVRARPAGGSTIVSINPSGEGESFTDVLRLDGRVIGANQLAAYGMNTAPLSASQILAVQEDPFNFSNAGDTDANPAITPNGRFVAFVSFDNVDDDPRDITPVNPEPGVDPDPFPTPDVFVKDFRSGAVLRANVDADGNVARTESGELATSFSPAVSANGRLVAFATDGVLTIGDQDPDTPEDTNNSGDVYLKNLATGNVTLVSADTAGESGGVPLLFGDGPFVPFGDGPFVAMSANGRFVAFMTAASLDTHLAETSDGNTDLLDVYVRDLRDDQIFLASIDDRGQAGGVSDPNNSETALDAVIDMSADGRFVAFTTAAVLNEDDGDSQADVYLWDRLAPLSAPMLVSGAAQVSPRDLSDSSNPSLSADGRFVAFESSTALVADDTNGVRDIYRWDRVENEIVRVSVDAASRQTALYDSFSPSISADGRFVAFSSVAGDLVPDDTSFGFTGRGFAEDIFIKDIHTGSITRASLDDEGGQAPPGTTSFSPSLSASGDLVAFLTNAPNILQVPQDFPNDTLVLTTVDFNLPRAVDIPDDPGTAASIGLSDFALRSTIDEADDRDWFDSFGSNTVVIDLEGSPTGQGTLTDPLVRVFRITDDGVEVVAFEDDDGGIGRNAHLEFRPSESENYFISAEGFGDETGTYRLRVLVDFDDQLSNIDTDETLALGTPAQGTIRATFDADWYAVQLDAGQSYRLELQNGASGGAPLTDPFLEVYDGNGNLLASDNNGGEGLNALLDFEAPSSGTFFVAARAVGEATGDYLLAGDVLIAPLGAASPLQLSEVIDADPGARGAGPTTMIPTNGGPALAAVEPASIGGALSSLLGEPGEMAVT